MMNNNKKLLPKQQQKNPNVDYEGTSLVGQWFRLHASPAGVTVQSLVWELRTHKPCSTANNNNTTTKKTQGF